MDNLWGVLYSARRLIGSRIIESAAYCNQVLLAPLYLNSTHNMSVYWIMFSLLSWPKVILLSGGHCTILGSRIHFLCASLCSKQKHLLWYWYLICRCKCSTMGVNIFNQFSRSGVYLCDGMGTFLNSSGETFVRLVFEGWPAVDVPSTPLSTSIEETAGKQNIIIGSVPRYHNSKVVSEIVRQKISCER